MKKLMTADEIYEKTRKEVAPLPCQESYLRELSAIFAYHLRKNALMDSGFSMEKLPYQGALVVAPTGSGKTFLFKAAARSLGINSVTIDCAGLTKDGWKGPSFSQQLMAAKQETKDDEAFSRSILFLDEIDKIKLYHEGHDESNPILNILQLYNGGKIAAELGTREVEYIDTKRWTIVLGGAFQEGNLEGIIQNRLAPKVSMGFGAEHGSPKIDSKNIMRYATPDDLEKYGIPRELVGRIGSIITIDPLEYRDYSLLLTAEHGSIQERYQNYFFCGYGVEFEITDHAVARIAEDCMDSTTGARAVNPIINNIMREAITMVDRDPSINKILLDANQEGCFLKYEYGEREYSRIAGNSIPAAPYYLSAKSLSSMTTKLCNLYKKAECDLMYLGEFRSFIRLTLNYLWYTTPPNDFCFESLQKLAQLVGKDRASGSSTFDVLMTNAKKYHDYNDEIWKCYHQFQKYWNRDTKHHLNKALLSIVRIIEKEYRSTDIRFRLEQCA